MEKNHEESEFGVGKFVGNMLAGFWCGNASDINMR
jgi:hypothetical protein